MTRSTKNPAPQSRREARPRVLLSDNVSEIRSVLTQNSLSTLAREFYIGVPFSVHAAGEHLVNTFPRNRVGVYQAHLALGLRFPFSSFQNEFFLEYGLVPEKLARNAIRVLVGFEVMCRMLDFMPTIMIFSNCFSILKLSSRSPWCYFCAIPPLTTFDGKLEKIKG